MVSVSEPNVRGTLFRMVVAPLAEVDDGSVDVGSSLHVGLSFQRSKVNFKPVGGLDGHSRVSVEGPTPVTR